MAGHEPPKLNTDTALNLVVSAWSLTFTGLASLALLVVLILETKYVTFDKVAQQYIHTATIPNFLAGLFGGRTQISTLELQEAGLIFFGISMICTGLAIMPLYQKDEPATALAPEPDKPAAAAN